MQFLNKSNSFYYLYMPLIKPKRYEQRENFLQRFMNNAKMILEYPDPKQRYAVAMDIWKKKFNQTCIIN